MTAFPACDVASRHRHFNELCSPHRPALLRYSRWLTRDRETAEDVVQAALLRAWSSIHTLENGETARSWLITITRREMARVHSRKRLPTEDIGMLSPEDELSISCQAQREDEDVRLAVGSMRKRDRDVLLPILLGYSIEEIAAREGCPRASISVRLFRARQRLREML